MPRAVVRGDGGSCVRTSSGADENVQELDSGDDGTTLGMY